MAGKLQFLYYSYSTLYIRRSEFFKEPKNHYGSKQENGSWTGLIGRVFHQKVHIGCSPLLWDAERIQVVDFLEPVYKAR